MTFLYFIFLNYNMTSKRNHKETHEETISKKQILDVFNRLVKIEKWAKETEAENKKDKAEKELLMAEVAKLNVDNENLQK